jgi:hypothetical protein
MPVAIGATSNGGKDMKKTAAVFTLLAAVFIFSQPLLAQEKPRAEEAVKPEVHPVALKIQVVFTEFDGDKKVKSMPYSTLLTAGTGGVEFAKIRIGSRVPLYTGKENGLQYIDIGTNLDFRADRLAAEKFEVKVSLERSWVNGDVMIPVEKSADVQSGGTPGQFKEPVIGQYKTDVNLLLRDGQTVESTVATDPLTGRLMKIELTLTVVK